MRSNIIFRSLIILFVPLLLTSCGAFVASPLSGGIYSDVQYPFMVTGEVGASKVGTSEATSVLGFVAMGDASIQRAMRRGGIEKVSHVDIHATSILGIFAKYTVYVYGE